jgi:hypothetical protein
MTSMFGPSWKQSTGQTSTQSVNLHLMQLSVTMKVMPYLMRRFGRLRILLQNRRASKPCDDVQPLAM